jgi:uncharacterized membrane protein
MKAANRWRDLIARQRAILSEIEAEYQAYENSDPAKENVRLKAALEKLRTDFEESRKSAAALADENRGLKNALYEQIYNEKIKIINTTAQKLNIYFRSSVEGELNRLSALERDVKRRVDGVREDLKRNSAGIRDEINARLDELSAFMDREVTEARSAAGAGDDVFSREELDRFEALKNERLTNEQVRAAARKNNLERFVGLNVLNALGVFLLIAGVVTVARYTYRWLPDMLKGILMFTLGGAMLAAGEFLNRRKPTVFSLGVSAGGVGVLYAALAASYFGLRILGMYPAVVICVLITTGAFVLSDRYNSQIIAVFALIGGYLPMYSISSDAAALYGAMLYFIALNLLALIVSFNKNWRVLSFTGLFLNMPGTVYICWNFYGADGNVDRALTILYVLFAFAVYAAIPIVGACRLKIKLKKSDITLLAINTFFSGLIMYGVFYNFDLQDYNGMLAVGFAAVYLLLGKFAERKLTADASALFYLTGLAFVTLVVPLQFGRVWLSLGWLAEGALLAVYGILRDEKRFKQAGFIISLLCLSVFVIFDCARTEHPLFAYKYFAITLGSWGVLGAYMYKKMTAGRFARVYKYFVLVNTWIYTLYIIEELRHALFGIFDGQTIYHLDYLTAAAAVTATFVIAYAAPRIRLLADSGTKIFSAALYAVGILTLFCLNTLYSPVARSYLSANTPAPGITAAGTAILAVLGMLSVFAARDLMKLIISERKLGVEWYPLIVSGYFVVIFTQNLIVQFGLSFSSAAISIIYVFAAFAWIVFGFARRYSFIRRFGLGLAIAAVVKLFLVDLFTLTQGYRIVSYFALGITLIAISFVYQYFSRRLEPAVKNADDSEGGVR